MRGGARVLAWKRKTSLPPWQRTRKARGTTLVRERLQDGRARLLTRDNGRIPSAAGASSAETRAPHRLAGDFGETQPGEARSQWLPVSCGVFSPTPPGHRRFVSSINRVVQPLQYMPDVAGWQSEAGDSSRAARASLAVSRKTRRRGFLRACPKLPTYGVGSPRRQTSWLRALQARF
jgi:hypothetical protein